MRWQAALLMLVGSCLPEAGPGVGAQVIAGRGLAEVALPPTGDSLLFTRFGPMPEGPDDGPDRTLFAQGPGGVRQLAEEVPVSWAEGSWDARGRLLVGHHRVLHAGAVQVQLDRFDLAAGTTDHLGTVRAFRLSPDGTMLVVQHSDGSVAVRGPDDVERPLGTRLQRARFLDGAIYYVDGAGLRRWRPGQDVDLVVPAATDWYPIPGDAGRLLAVVPASPDTQLVALAGNDVLTRALATASLRSAPAVSPDGRRAAFLESDGDPDSLRARVLALDSDETRTAPLDAPVALDRPLPRSFLTPDTGPLNEIVFRPRSDEIWFLLAGRLRAVQRGGELRATATRRLMLPRIEGGVRPAFDFGAGDPGDGLPGSVFTSDGARWLYLDDDGHVYLGRADDPDAPSAQALDLGVFRAFTADSLREVGDGRWLVVRSAPAADRQDLAVVDLRAGTLRPLAEHLGPAVSDGTRTLAIVGKVNQWWAPGELTSFDLETGAGTVLAHSVTQLALAPACPGCALTAPGARLLYVVQARVPWRYDGLWRATLP